MLPGLRQGPSTRIDPAVEQALPTVVTLDAHLLALRAIMPSSMEITIAVPGEVYLAARMVESSHDHGAIDRLDLDADRQIRVGKHATQGFGHVGHGTIVSLASLVAGFASGVALADRYPEGRAGSSQVTGQSAVGGQVEVDRRHG